MCLSIRLRVPCFRPEITCQQLACHKLEAVQAAYNTFIYKHLYRSFCFVCSACLMNYKTLVGLIVLICLSINVLNVPTIARHKSCMSSKRIRHHTALLPNLDSSRLRAASTAISCSLPHATLHNGLFVHFQRIECKTADRFSRHLQDTLPALRIQLYASRDSTPWAHKSATFPEDPHSIANLDLPAVQMPI